MSSSPASMAVASDVAPQSTAAVKPLLDQAIWSVAPSIVWAIVVVAVLYCFRKEIQQLFQAFVARVRDGASLKVAGVEIGASSGLVATPGAFSSSDTGVGVYVDDGSRARHREEQYRDAHGAMMVHRLQRSNEDGQLYDILIYVVPHKSSLAGVVSVEYFFGSFWGNKVFPSHDRSRGFPIFTSAYGAFMCTAKVLFNDGTSVLLSRYIDFEMGNVVPRSID